MTAVALASMVFMLVILPIECVSDGLTQLGPTGFTFGLRLGAGQVEAVDSIRKNFRRVHGFEISGYATAPQTQVRGVTLEGNGFELHFLNAVQVESATATKNQNKYV